MTEIKALERLKICLECGDCLTCEEHDEAIKVAINVLQEKIKKVKIKKIVRSCESCAYQGQMYIPIGCTRCKGKCADCGEKLRNYYPLKYYTKLVNCE